MKFASTCIKNVAIVTTFFACFYSYAFDSTAMEKQANSSIEELYHKLNDMPNISMTQRIDWISKQFLGVPYILGSLGEGPKARYDQFPRYRLDGFDCDTYVNTVISLALASSLPSFQQCINEMRYNKGAISYINRLHFTGLDWNNEHQQTGLFKDITLSFKDKNNQPIAKIASTQVEKPNWYALKTIETIRLQNADKKQQQARLAELKAKGARLTTTATEAVPYIPLSVLFPKDHQPDMHLFAQIPDGAIIEIVRPNWDLRNEIGTALNISHLGFAIRDKNQLYFRQASSQYAKVVDVPLIEYLQNVLSSPTIKGINVQIIVPTQPTKDSCKNAVSKSNQFK
ncbi:MAG: DUF1460 domain-containing protein [Legionella sp.]|uniref:N-acetylmuramoyl-L-alanine amidase-like domain-containing protein n=1 Tax=Legionella sp. TaxID=459 RepID=UPI0039E2E2EA